MSTLFPFSFPLPTAFYLVLYVVTLVVHVLLMNYVLAGSLYVGWVSVMTGGGRQRQRSAMALMIRDWMPFAIGAAITAGVAPLLFVQILYPRSFYTANLLLSHRWMSILPVLIVGFYLTYVLKSRMIGRWRAPVRALVGVGAFACFAFTAYTWTENHLLSLAGHPRWAQLYEAGSIFYFNPPIVPRLGAWFIGALPTMAILVGWQLRRAKQRGEEVASSEPRRAAILAIVGLVLAGACWEGYRFLDAAQGEAAVQQAMQTAMARPFLYLAGAGAALQVIAWALIGLRGRFATGPLIAASIGCVGTLLGMAVLREAIRIGSMDFAALYERHAAAWGVGGLPVFLLFFVVNAGAVLYVIRTIVRERVAPSAID